MSFSQSTWIQLTSPTVNSITDMHFYNNQTGWLTSNSGVHKTTNGGANWISQSVDDAELVSFVDANTGIVFFQQGSDGTKRTTNGGTTWQDFFAFGNTINDLQLLDGNTAFAVGGSTASSGYVYKTTNGGINWVQVYSQTTGRYHSVHFINSYTGWASGQNGVISKTTDAGSTWIAQSVFATNTHYDIWFVNEETGWISHGGINIRKSTSGGLNWTTQTLPNPSGLALHFSNTFDGRVVGEGGNIARTINGGLNWIIETSPTSQQLNEILFTGNDTGYICGNNGTLLKTTNGSSITNIQNISTENPNHFSISQNYPNPFNPVTNIEFSVPFGDAYMRSVQLIIFDALGKEVETLVNSELAPGVYKVDWNAVNYPSGVYFYRLTADGFTETRKMMLIK